MFVITKYYHTIQSNPIRCCQLILCFSFLDLHLSLSDQVASAVAMCGQAMPQLRTVSIHWINPLPLLRALGDRECPIDNVKVDTPKWVCTILMWVY